MANTLVLTVMGSDRSGLVARLATCVASHGGNWLESRLVRLGGQFAGVLRVEATPENAERIAAALEGLEGEGIRCLVEREELAPPQERGTQLVQLDLIGSDRPGILKAISLVLERHGVNVEELTTERRAAPMSGEILFQAKTVIYIPSKAVVRELRADLEKIADDLMVDLLFGETTGRE